MTGSAMRVPGGACTYDRRTWEREGCEPPEGDREGDSHGEAEGEKGENASSVCASSSSSTGPRPGAVVVSFELRARKLVVHSSGFRRWGSGHFILSRSPRALSRCRSRSLWVRVWSACADVQLFAIFVLINLRVPASLNEREHNRTCHPAPSARKPCHFVFSRRMLSGLAEHMPPTSAHCFILHPRDCHG